MLPPIAVATALEETKFYCGLGRCGGGLTEATDGCVTHRLREILEQSDLVVSAADGPAGGWLGLVFHEVTAPLP